MGVAYRGARTNAVFEVAETQLPGVFFEGEVQGLGGGGRRERGLACELAEPHEGLGLGAWLRVGGWAVPH